LFRIINLIVEFELYLNLTKEKLYIFRILKILMTIFILSHIIGCGWFYVSKDL